MTKLPDHKYFTAIMLAGIFVMGALVLQNQMLINEQEAASYRSGTLNRGNEAGQQSNPSPEPTYGERYNAGNDTYEKCDCVRENGHSGKKNSAGFCRASDCIAPSEL